jgi:hypothetical protein
MHGQPPQFAQWVNFYVVTAAAAATLLGLLFVVITLGAERGRKEAPRVRIYLTPAVIHLSAVLLMSAILAIPNHTRLSASICICLEGIAGVGYVCSLAVRRGAGDAFYAHRSDVFPYVVFPVAAYGVMVAGGLLLLEDAHMSPDLVAARMLALLVIAIRNSWSIAITIVTSHG